VLHQLGPRFDFENSTSLSVPVAGPHVNPVVLAEQVGYAGLKRYRDITSSIDIYYDHDENADAWNLVLVTAIPITGFIQTL